MKTNSATIKLHLKKDKIYADGSSPIVININWKGRKQVATGVSVTERYWDKKNMCIKNTFPNAPVLNKIISDKLNAVINYKLSLESAGKSYTVSMLADACRCDYVDDDSFAGLMNSMFNERHLAYNTRKGKEAVFSSLCKFFGNKTFKIGDLSLHKLEAYAIYLKRNGSTNGTIQTYLAVVANMMKYAIEKGKMELNEYPFTRFNYIKKYPVDNKKRALNEEQINQIIGYLSSIALSDAVEFKLSDKYLNALHKFGYITSLNLWLFSYLAQGLAMADVLSLKRKNFEIKTINGTDCYVISTARRKTHQLVDIIIPIDDLSHMVIAPWLDGKSDDDYLIISKLNGLKDEDKIAKIIKSKVVDLNRGLKIAVKKANKYKEKYCQDNGIDEYLLLPEDMQMYSARHSFMSMYMSKGGNLTSAASMMGRGLSGIERYYKSLQTEESILEERLKMK